MDEIIPNDFIMASSILHLLNFHYDSLTLLCRWIGDTLAGGLYQ